MNRETWRRPPGLRPARPAAFCAPQLPPAPRFRLWSFQPIHSHKLTLLRRTVQPRVISIKDASCRGSTERRLEKTRPEGKQARFQGLLTALTRYKASALHSQKTDARKKQAPPLSPSQRPAPRALGAK